MLLKLKKVAKNSRIAFEKQIDSKKKDMVLKRFASQLFINKKKIIFDDTEDRHAQLRVRLEYDGLSQAEFFRALVTGYLNKNDEINSFIKSYKSQYKTQSKRNLKYINDDDQKSNDMLGKFGIKDNELEDIFDLIAEQHPDL